MLDKVVQEVPGQLHAPFKNLGTEAAGLMLVPNEVFDFAKRLHTFCRKWQKPEVDAGIESVVECVTSLPFDVLREHPGNSSSKGAAWGEGPTKGAGLFGDDAKMKSVDDMGWTPSKENGYPHDVCVIPV